METKINLSIKYDRVLKDVDLWEDKVIDASEVRDYNWKPDVKQVKVGSPITLVDIIERCPELAHDAIRGTVNAEITIKWNRTDNYENTH